MTTLIDSSIWIDFFRGKKATINRVDQLLVNGTAAITGPIAAEVLSGTKSLKDYNLLSQKFLGLTWLDPQVDVWHQIAETRFTLARSRHQAGLIDLLIAHTAHSNQARLLTADNDFKAISRVLSIDLEFV